MNQIDSTEIDSYILPKTESIDIFSKSHGYHVVPTGASITPAGINCVCATDNFKWIFTGGQDGFIRKYDLMQYFQDPISLSANVRQGLADSSISNSVPLVSAWESNDGGPIAVHSIDVHSQAVWCVTGLENGLIRLWTFRQEEGTCVHTIEAHSSSVSALKICGGERQLLSGSWDKSIKLWSLDDGSLLHDIGTMKSQVTCISLNPLSDISFCATSFDGTLWIYNNISKQPKIISGNSLQSKTNWTLTACWSVCGEKIYIGRRNEGVDIVDVTRGVIISNIKLLPGSGWITSVMIFPNNRHLLISSHDTIRLWDLEFSVPEEGQEDGTEQVAFSTISGHSSGMVSSAIISKSGGLLVTVSGSRGYEGFNSSNQLILYELFPKFNNLNNNL